MAFDAKGLATVDQWQATIQERVGVHLQPFTDDALMNMEAIIRNHPKQFMDMMPGDKADFPALCIYLAIANELKRRAESQQLS